MATNGKLTVFIPTKDRHFTTLPMAISSICSQTRKPDNVLIFDNSDAPPDIQNNNVYGNLFRLMSASGINWNYNFIPEKGLMASHNRCLETITDRDALIFRIDDDTILMPNVIEELMNTLDDETGAVASLIIDPALSGITINYNLATDKMENFYYKGMGMQWFRHPDNKIKECERLYSSFIYRRSVADHGFNKKLSKFSLHEETTFTHEIFRKGWKLKVNPNATMWHLRANTGGCVSVFQREEYVNDCALFEAKLKEWGVIAPRPKYIYLDKDHEHHKVVKEILGEIKEKYHYPEHKLVIGAKYPEYFKDDKDCLVTNNIFEGEILCMSWNMNKDGFDIDKWINQNSFNGNLKDAYRKFYGV